MATTLRFDLFELDTHALELRRDGVPVPLRPQPCRVLTCLARRPGLLVTREELRDRLWPAGTFVRFDQGLNSCMKQIRAALGDQADRPRFVETLPRRGYRFLLAVTEVAGALPAIRRHRLAVLPFSALDGDPGSPLVTEGFTEELISRLAGLRPDRLGVLACAHAAHGGTVAGLAGEPEADFLVKGSIRHSAGRLRVTAQLISVRDRLHVWARSYERVITDPLLWQDEAAATIAKEIVGTFRLPAAP